MAQQVPPPPAYDVAAEEFAVLRQQNSGEALSMFIARHPHHPLVETALQLLREGTVPLGSFAGPDAEIYRAFAGAVAQGGPAALRNFASSHLDNPLTAIARRLAEHAP